MTTVLNAHSPMHFGVEPFGKTIFPRIQWFSDVDERKKIIPGID